MLCRPAAERGEREVVLQYLEGLCGFWTLECDERLKEWADAVRRGEMPDFGSNLIY